LKHKRDTLEQGIQAEEQERAGYEEHLAHLQQQLEDVAERLKRKVGAALLLDGIFETVCVL
jgi:hypothetical protein